MVIRASTLDEKKSLDLEKKEQIASAPADSKALAHDHAKDCPPAPARDKKSANNLFNKLNYFGLGFVANSSLSLWITYNVMPTKWAQARIDDLRGVLMPVAGVWDKAKGMINPKKAAQFNHAIREAHVGESARSMAEILCMCIAGCIVLVPMKLLEDHKKAIVNKIDHIENPQYHQHCLENHIKPEALPFEKEDKHLTWGNLLTARAAGVASVIGIDAAFQMFNNKRHDKGKWNLDTAEWKMGGKIYDALPEKVGKKFTDFFTADKRANATSLDNIQPMLRKRLTDSVGHDSNRMMFAEQTRLFTKEVSLTLVMAGIVYTLAKAGGITPILSKLGLKKPEEQKEAVDGLLQEVPFVPVTEGNLDLSDSQTKHTEKLEKNRSKSTVQRHEQHVQHAASDPHAALAL